MLISSDNLPSCRIPLGDMCVPHAYGQEGPLGETIFYSAYEQPRDWAGNVTSFPREVTETALAHVIGDKAEQAYRRGDALDKRRILMEAWAAYCEPERPAKVFAIHATKRN
jgi:hypothetical protein